MLEIVNAAAVAYRGVIPADRWHEPYMPREELESEIAHGVEFWVAEREGRMLGVMGMQDKGDVALVRHAYVAPNLQRSGVGTSLLRHVTAFIEKPILIGTWAAASWAIAFYQRNGFALVSSDEKDRLLRRYWSIPPRQVETSVVLEKAPTAVARKGKPRDWNEWVGNLPFVITGPITLAVLSFYGWYIYRWETTGERPMLGVMRFAFIKHPEIFIPLSVGLLVGGVVLAVRRYRRTGRSGVKPFLVVAAIFAVTLFVWDAPWNRTNP